METSPEFNQPPIDPRDALVVAHIDKTLADYDSDHQRALEEANWRDLQTFVRAGELTDEQAQQRHLEWLANRGQSLI